MKLLPLFIFWCLWFLNFSTRTVFSPILPLIEDSLSISHGKAGGLYSILPLYLIKERGISFGLATNLFGISRAGGMVVPILIGFLIDRYGYRKMLVWGIITTGLSTIGLSLASALPFIVIALVLQATFSLAFFPIGLASISKLTPLSERAMATGVIISIGVIFGLGLTPFLLGVVADHFNFQTGILGLGMLTTLSSLMVRFLKDG